MKRLGAVLAILATFVATSVALASAGPTGSWKTKISGKSVLGGAIDGAWIAAFSGGHYTITWNGQAVVHGVYTVSGADVILADKSGKAACAGMGTYKFKASASTLSFTKVKDTKACPGRDAVLTTAPLKKG